MRRRMDDLTARTYNDIVKARAFDRLISECTLPPQALTIVNEAVRRLETVRAASH